MNSVNFLFIGHFAIDIIIKFGKANNPTLGGSVSFGSLSLRTYSKDVDISIISNLGKLNFDNSLLEVVRTKNIDLRGIKFSDSFNTNFVLDYSNHSRTLTLKSKSPNLEFRDIPEDYLNSSPDVIVLVPVCNEISYQYVSEILIYFPNSYIAIDLQGFLRKIDKKGEVLYNYDPKIINNMNNIIKLVGEKLILKGSEEEMKLLSNIKNNYYDIMKYFCNFKGLFIMTMGEKGSMVAKYGKKILKIPAFKSRGVVDETGAGDVYFAIFLYEFICCSDRSWKSIERAAYLASSAASFNVEKIGPDGFETKENVLKRVNSKNIIK